MGEPKIAILGQNTAVNEPGAGRESPAWLRGGYRLLFGCGALWAIVVVTRWIGTLQGSLRLPTAMDALSWHQREMLFGHLGAVIGGFISAAFTRNWMMRQGRSEGPPIMPNRFDIAVIAVTALALAGWAAAPENHIVGILPRLAGAMGAMPLAVTTRATRGHTGRPLEADPITVCIYLLVHLGALLRVAAPLLPTDYMLAIRLAGGLWDAAFVLFLVVYAPMALRPEPAKRG